MADNHVRVFNTPHVLHRNLDIELRQWPQFTAVAPGEHNGFAAGLISILDGTDDIGRIAGAANRHYEIARLGEEHPLICTQYLLRPLDEVGRLFSPAARALLQGTHVRLGGAQAGETYVAGVDVAGQDEQAAPGLLVPGAMQGGRDSTVVTVARLTWDAEREPALEVVQHYSWSGADHPTQHHALRSLLAETFPCVRVVVDATGLGAGVASWLATALGPSVVEPFVFSAPSKSRLGFLLLAMAGTGRCRLYRPDGSSDAMRVWHEIAAARYELAGNEQLRFSVPSEEGHDDYLISLALCCRAASEAAPPPESLVIPPRPMSYGRW